MKLIIVERHQISTYERLLEKFSDHLGVTVVWDRRIGERRQRTSTRSEERRKGDRRALVKSWAGQDYIVVHSW